MPIEAKISFIGTLEEKLSDKLTMKDLQQTLAIVNDVLDDYRLEQLRVFEVAEDDLLEFYTSALRVEGRSEKTIARYAYILGRLQEFTKVPWRRVTIHHLRAFLAAEQARGIGDSTLEGNREVYSAFFNWLHREGLIEKNPVANLGKIKCEKKQKKAYSSIDLEKLKRGCKTARDRAMIAFLGSTGCRISEALGLDRDAVDLIRLECTVRGKGKKERTVYLDQVAGELLKEYLQQRTDKDPALFVNRYGHRMASNAARVALKNVANAAHVDNVHPHRFRRTLATELTRHGMPIQEVAQILGHEKLDTTMKYVVLDNTMIKSSYNRYRG